jgi:hypothetical protein
MKGAKGKLRGEGVKAKTRKARVKAPRFSNVESSKE